MNFSTVSEKQIIKAIYANRGLLKVSFNFRLPEGRFKVDKAIMRNNEIRESLINRLLIEGIAVGRVLRRQATEEARKACEAAEPPKKPPVVAAAPPPPPEPPKVCSR